MLSFFGPERRFIDSPYLSSLRPTVRCQDIRCIERTVQYHNNVLAAMNAPPKTKTKQSKAEQKNKQRGKPTTQNFGVPQDKKIANQCSRFTKRRRSAPEEPPEIVIITSGKLFTVSTCRQRLANNIIALRFTKKTARGCVPAQRQFSRRCCGLELAWHKVTYSSFDYYTTGWCARPHTL